MFKLHADKNKLALREREAVTSGSKNVYTVHFTFSADWNGLTRIAVFQYGDRKISVSLDDNGDCRIPWEVLSSYGRPLMVGVYGAQDDTIILPTVWVSLGTVLQGASLGDTPEPGPLPEDWQEALNSKGDALGYTDTGELGLYSGEELLSSVPVAGGEGGATDHRVLTHRDAAEQHPIGSISGLKEELDRIPAPVEALTNSELEEMLK